MEDLAERFPYVLRQNALAAIGEDPPVADAAPPALDPGTNTIAISAPANEAGPVSNLVGAACMGY